MKKQFSIALTFTLLVVMMVASVALASSTTMPSAQIAAPTIASDLPDYGPGDLVTLTSAGWQAGETVNIIVNDDAGSTWNRNVYVIAADDGTFTDTFNLPNWFVATYSVTATGATSGTATTTFTDSVTSVTVTSPTHSSPVTVTLLPTTVTVFFSYVTSPTGTTNATADVLGTSISVTKNIAPGTGSDSIDVPIPTGTANGTFNLKVTVINSTGGGANNGNDNQNGAVVINVEKTTPVITWANPADIVYGTALSGTQLNATTSVDGSFAYTPVAGTVLNAGNAQTLHVDFTPTDTANYNNASKNVTINVLKATPVVTWANPADIIYGTALSSTQLNATASVAGSFVYTPVAGTVLNAGNGQTLHVSFTPTDTANYIGASKDVTINVLKATPVITWANPADIVYGTALSATQLNATASVPGTFAYTPVTGTVLNAGNGQILNVDFTPTDTANYNGASKNVSINVKKTDATCTVSGYSGVYDAAAHGVTGSCTGVGGVDLSGSLNLGATFTDVPGGTANWSFTGGTNYNDQSGTAAIVINKANATINVVGYTGVYDGNAHGASGTATGVGDVDLSGSLNLGATFTDVPGGTANWIFTGGTNYNDQSGTAAIVINKADAVIVVTPYNVVYDSASHTATGTATGVKGEILSGLNLSGTTHTAPGDYLTDAWTFTGGTNYNNASGTVHDNIHYATSGTCYGAPGHTILQPINADGLSVFKQRSTVPAKFRVCDANGNSVGTAGVVQSFKLLSISGAPTSAVNETVDSTTPDLAFRWSATDQQWIFNINTKYLATGTYVYLITLNDGSTITFQFGLK